MTSDEILPQPWHMEKAVSVFRDELRGRAPGKDAAGSYLREYYGSPTPLAQPRRSYAHPSQTSSALRPVPPEGHREGHPLERPRHAPNSDGK